MKIVFIRPRLIRDGKQNTPAETRYAEGQELDCSEASARYFINCGDAIEKPIEVPESPIVMDLALPPDDEPAADLDLAEPSLPRRGSRK